MAGPMSAEDFYDLKQGEWKSAIEILPTSKMTKSFHLYLASESPDILHSYSKTKEALDNESPVIKTTQAKLCTDALFEKGYRIFVYPKVGDMFEITYDDCFVNGLQQSVDALLLYGGFKKEGRVLF